MINPILKKEMYEKLRSYKFVAMLTGYGVVLYFFAYLFLDTVLRRNGEVIALDSASHLMMQLLGFFYFILCFISPALTASCINSEKRGQTMDLLTVSPISSFRIVLGKLLSSLLSVFYLILITAPLFAILLFFGTITINNLFMFILYFILVSIFYGSIGILSSSVFKKISVSTVISYIVILFLNIGTLLIGYVVPEVFNFSKSSSKLFEKILYINPGNGFYKLVEKTFDFYSQANQIGFSLWIIVFIQIILSIIILKIVSLRIEEI